MHECNVLVSAIPLSISVSGFLDERPQLARKKFLGVQEFWPMYRGNWSTVQ